MTEDYNQRQFKLMLNRLDAFESGDISLASLIGDLRGLGNAIMDIPERWKSEYQLNCNDLEVARALMTGEAVTTKERLDKNIGEAIMHLRFLVLHKIDPRKG